MTANDANAGAIEAWDGVLFDKFSRFREVLTTGLGAHGTAALARHRPPEGAHVLDIGCGFGDATIEIARLVGPRGRATGVDAARNFVEEARRGARELKSENIDYFAADVQVDDLRGPYAYAFSRFGTMFFAAPVAALRNTRKSLAPGASLVMVVWRRREDNPWTHAAELAVSEIIPPVDHGDEPTCGPGPFSMAGADMVSSQLIAAGFEEVCFERHDADICIGKDLEDALEFAKALGPAGELIRLAAAQGIQETERVDRALRTALLPYVKPNGVYAPSSTWFVTARSS
jgi:ubiquinone/menaquinone biosynthesis C-methylase UbiE